MFPKTIFLLLPLLTIAQAWRSMPHHSSSSYGKPCVNSSIPEGSKVVNCKSPLFCTSEGYCACIPDEERRNIMYDEEMQTCVLIPNAGDDFHCGTDFQCQSSSFGRYSRCNPDTAKCECYSPSTTTELRDNVCYVVRPIAFSDSYPSCQFDSECQVSALGGLSRCNSVNLKCECYDSVMSGKADVGYYQGECVYERHLGSFCEHDAQCKVVHEGAECKEHSAYLANERTCQCPEGKACDGSSGANNHVFFLGLTTVLMGIVASVV